MGRDVNSIPIEVRRDMALRAMNQGWALRVRGEFETALLAYEEALAYWTPRPPSADVAWRNSAGTCHLNRGELLLQLGRAGALAATDEAIACFQPELTEAWTPLRRNLAGAWANRVQIEAQQSRESFPAKGNSLKHSVCRCLDLVLPFLGTAPEAGPLALQALRHGVEAIGHALPQLLPEQQTAWGEVATQWIHQGLALLKGLPTPTPATPELAARLLYFGGQLHAHGAPEQLVPFFVRHQTLFQAAGWEAQWRTAADAALRTWEGTHQRAQLWDARSPQTQAALANIHRLRSWAKNEGLR